MSENNRASVYVHINLVNGKKYFGITTQDPPEKRWKNGNGYYNNAHFMSAVKKYGWDNFGHFVLYRSIPIQIAKSIENLLINEHISYDPRFGYNKTHGGELEIPTEETRRKMSESMKGHKITEETKEKISESLKGRTHSEETRKKMSDAQKGKTRSKETRMKISESMNGHEVSEKTRCAISKAKSKPVEAIDQESG